MDLGPDRCPFPRVRRAGIPISRRPEMRRLSIRCLGCIRSVHCFCGSPRGPQAVPHGSRDPGWIRPGFASTPSRRSRCARSTTPDPSGDRPWCSISPDLDTLEQQAGGRDEDEDQDGDFPLTSAVPRGPPRGRFLPDLFPRTRKESTHRQPTHGRRAGQRLPHWRRSIHETTARPG